MHTRRLAWSLVALVFLGGNLAGAQSLADIAKKEQERRKTVKPTGKVLTNDDLAKYPSAATPPAEATKVQPPEQPAPDEAKPGEQAKAAEPAKPADQGDRKDEASWKKSMLDARTKLDRDQSYLDALQSKINALTNDFYARDDPAQRGVLWGQRNKALGEMERLKKEVADDQKAITKIQEDARRAGVPPGWLR